MSTPQDPERPPVDPFELLAAMVARDDRRLDPGDDRAADALLERIVSDPVVVPIGRRAHRRVVAAVAAVAVIGAGTAVAAVWGREPADAVTLRCYSTATADSPIVVGLDADPDRTPAEQCAAAWQDGRISTEGAPPLTACVDEFDSTVVVPGGPDACATLGWAPAAAPGGTARVDAQVVREVAAVLNPCITDPAEAEASVRAMLGRLGADHWTVSVGALSGRGCVIAAPDRVAHMIVLIELPPTP